MENTWEFDTTIGQGSEVVTVVYEYEIGRRQIHVQRVCEGSLVLRA
jgi:hypothetical protein